LAVLLTLLGTTFAGAAWSAGMFLRGRRGSERNQQRCSDSR
jgi:hypothetical protein